MAHVPFVPLRVFSSYTMLDGAIDPKGIARLAKERGFPAIAITDRNGLYGVVPFANACRMKCRSGLPTAVFSSSPSTANHAAKTTWPARA